MRICFSFFLLGGIADKRFRLTPIGIDYRCYRSVVCLSVCLSVTFVHCAQTTEDIDPISFAYNSPMPLPDRDGYVTEKRHNRLCSPPTKNSLK